MERRFIQGFYFDRLKNLRIKKGFKKGIRFPFPGNNLTVLYSQVNIEPNQVRDCHDIGPSPRRNGPPVLQAKPLARVEGGHLHGRHWVEAPANSLAQKVVNFSLPDEVAGFQVIEDEEAAVLVLGGYHREQVLKILSGRSLADHQPHSQPDFFFSLFLARAFMIGFVPRGNVGV